jgi:Probable lipoprotein LpqN
VGYPTGRAVVATLVVSTVLASGCARAVDGRPVAASSEVIADDSQCTKVDAPLTTIPHATGASDDFEPTLRIPQPDGWDRFTDLDSAVIRFAMGNRHLKVNDRAPSAVVTMESHPGVLDAQTFFDEGRKSLVSMFGATDVSFVDGTLCGLPAQTVRYTIPQMGTVAPIPATVVMAVLYSGDKTYGTALTIQSPRPDDPVYQKDAADITTGFQVLAPDS